MASTRLLSRVAEIRACAAGEWGAARLLILPQHQFTVKDSRWTN